jgi:hypothetical protein
MLAASSVGLFLIPMLYVVFENMREWSHRRLENRRKLDMSPRRDGAAGSA